MEYVSGVALKEIWGRMTELQHIELIESVAELVKELCALDFGAFGSLYLNTAEKPTGTLLIDEEYCIGPHCGRQFWGFKNNLTIQDAIPLGSQGPCTLAFSIAFCLCQLILFRARLVHFFRSSQSHQQGNYRQTRIPRKNC
jgi:hypothetical protein